MPVYRTTFEVNASADTVWRVPSTLDRYGEWNPQIPRATGAIANRARSTCVSFYRAGQR